MGNKAYFFSGIDNFDLLVLRTKEAARKGYVCQKYKVIETIKLSDLKFCEFMKNLSDKQDFLSNITASLKISNEGEYLCLAVTNDYNEAIILVCTFQYSYPKFIAVVRRDGYGEKIY